MFEVKPLDSDTDLDALAKKILAIQMDGLFWKTEYKKVPVAFGIFKLIVDVTVEDGGKRLISVADNGAGMDGENLAMAFCPHATSKIDSEEDLLGIETIEQM